MYGARIAPPMASYSNSVEEIVVELAKELKKKPSIEIESIKMDNRIWRRVPEELLMSIIDCLPTLISWRFRAVCKRWKYLLSPPPTFQRLSITIPPICSSPGFLLGCAPGPYFRDTTSDYLYLLQAVPHSRMHRLLLDFLGPGSFRVVAASKSLLCCSKVGEPTSFYICNPVIRTLIKLPPVTTDLTWDFIGIEFDITAQCCYLLVGGTLMNNLKLYMWMEIYDSNSNSWTNLMSNKRVLFCPQGEGVISRGTMYWICQGLHFKYGVVSFDVANKLWDIIRLPERPGASDRRKGCHWNLTGYDGKLILVDRKDLTFWRYEDNEYTWTELQGVAQKSFYEETMRSGLSDHTQVVVNSSGWVLVQFNRNIFVILDDNGRVMEVGKLPSIWEHTDPIRFRSFEINNIWWPF